MFKIVQLDHLVLRVHYLQTMLQFYTEVLGCTLERAEDDIGLYQLRAGQSMIDLVPVNGKLGREGGRGPEAEGRNLDHLCLRIEPFNAKEIKAYLKRFDIECSEPSNRYGAEGLGPSLYVKDPEGNVVELKGPAQKT